jgi:diaminopimelate epimerase
MTTTCAITTMQGLGNRLHLLRDDAFEFTGAHAIAVCRARRADGVIVHGRVEDSHRCVIWNADGSSAELCGNGLRCLVRLGVEEGWLAPDGDHLHSDAGRHRVRMDSDGRVTVSMPMPQHGGGAVDMVPHDDFELEGDGAVYVQNDRRLHVHLVSTGNPHAVLFVERTGHAAMLSSLGPELGRHAAFPSGINVHLADVSDDRVHLSTWERGAGPTPACATGATAAVAAAISAGMITGGAVADMAGGELEVRFESNVAWNTGAADHVGTWTMALESTDEDPPIRA